ncbi:general substrate transporter [Melampsora americana]|nr:general substrate transporter [Melampsora americana]
MPTKLVGQPLLYAISTFASLGVFLFGYDQGVMSGIITGPYFKSFFQQPTHYEIGTMVAILEIGAFITSIIAGQLGDLVGRRRTLFIGAVIFTIGGAIQTFADGFSSMILGRIISGFGVGFLSTIVPVYQSEISPAEHRGQLACIEWTGNICGYTSSVWIDYFSSFIESHWSWRLPLLVQCIIGAILAIGSLIIPESPRWLLDTDQDVAGMRVLVDLSGGNPRSERAHQEYSEIKEAVLDDRLSPDRSYRAMWTRYRGRVLLAMSSQAFAQLNGINVIAYYAPLVFESAGWIGRDAIFMTAINGLVYIASTIPPWYLMDRWGRRFILLSGAVGMAIALTVMGWLIHLDAPFTPIGVVICVMVYISCFGYSWGPIPWLYPPEIIPLPFRVKGVSISTATNWFFNYIIGEATPVLQDVIAWRLYPMHAISCILSFILVYFAYPETCGVPLEEMDELFGDVGLEDTEHQSLVNSERSSIRNALEPPNLIEIDESERLNPLQSFIRRDTHLPMLISSEQD